MENQNTPDPISTLTIDNTYNLYEQSKPGLRFIEFLFLFVLMGLYWSQYTFIGDLVSHWEVNYIDLITLPLDRKIPFTTIWSFFYSSALVVPFAFAWIIFFRYKLDLLIAYRMVLTCVSTLTIHYLIYILFPTDMFLWKYPGFQAFWQHIQTPGWLNENTKFILSITSPGNSFPSYHIGSGWIMLRYTFERFKVLGCIFLVWFIGMCIGAFTLKIHVILDGVAGIIISELLYQLYKTKKVNNYLVKWVNRYPRKSIIFGYFCCILILASVVIYEFRHIQPVVMAGFISAK